MRRRLVVEGPGGACRRVEAAADGDGALRVRVEGTEEPVFARPAPAGFTLRHGRRTVEAGVTPIRPGTVDVRIGSGIFRITAGRSRRAVAGGRIRGDGAAGVDVRTPMPGKVVRILRANGKTVAAGDGVVVFEAMKMQNEIRAPAAGVVAKLRVASGALLEGGAFLFTVSPEPPPRTESP